MEKKSPFKPSERTLWAMEPQPNTTRRKVPAKFVFAALRLHWGHKLLLTSTLGQELPGARAGDPQAPGGAAPGLLGGRHGDVSQDPELRSGAWCQLTQRDWGQSQSSLRGAALSGSGQPLTHNTEAHSWRWRAQSHDTFRSKAAEISLFSNIWPLKSSQF